MGLARGSRKFWTRLHLNSLPSHRNSQLPYPQQIMAGTKRKRGKDSEEIYNNNDGRSRPPVEPRVDPTYGQRSAIPGLDDDTTMDCEEEPLNYDEGMDALSYLRAVRLVNPPLHILYSVLRIRLHV